MGTGIVKRCHHEGTLRSTKEHQGKRKIIFEWRQRDYSTPVWLKEYGEERTVKRGQVIR
jgi:hypothetical protein